MKLASFVLASILAQTRSQQVPVQFTDSVAALEYGSSSEFTCSWDFSAIENVNLNDSPAFTVSWSQGLTKIVSIKSDGSLRPAFSERWSNSYTASIEGSTSTFSINSAQLTDSGDFSCHVELDDMVKRNTDEVEGVVQGQDVKSVSIYNNPDVSLESAGQIDIRSSQMNGDQEEKTIGTCKVANAFPRPSKMTAFINGEEVASTSDIVSKKQDDDLYSASWEIKTTVDGKQMHGQNFSCSVTDDEGNWEENDARFQLDIMYLPTEDDVFVLFNNGADVYENSNVTVSCQKGGNPELEPELQFLSDDVGDNFITEIKRDNTNEYACTLQDTEYALNITSAADRVDVFFLDDPVLSSPSGESSIDLASGHSATLTCAVAANPPATITWIRNGVEIDATSSTFKVNGNEDSHEGSYECKVSIPDMVKQSRKIDIDIQEKCRIKDVDANTIQKGDFAITTFTCLLENENTEPKCKFDWKYTDDVKPQVKKQNGNTIIFEDVVFQETSNVRCTVINEAMKVAAEKIVSNKVLAMNSADQGMSTLVQVVIGAIILLILVAGCFVYRKKKASKEPQAEALQGQSV